MTPRHTIREDPPSCPAQLQRGVEKPAACLLCPAEPCMHFTPSFNPHLGGKQPVPRSSSSIHACQLPRAISDLMLLLLLGSVCMNTLRLLSLKMAAAIPGSNPSFSVNRVCMHLSHRTQPLQVRAVQSSVIVSYQKVCSPCRTASIGHADVETSRVGQPLPGSVPSNPVQSSPPSSARMKPPHSHSQEKGHHCPM